MGNSAGKHDVGNPKFPIQPSLPPYNGCPVQYHLLIIEAILESQQRFSFHSPDISFLCTNIDGYFPNLASLYQHGYRMLTFAAFPQSTITYGLSNPGRMTSRLKFQGVFRKMFPEEMNQKWELRSAKSLFVNQMFRVWNGTISLSQQSGSASDSHHIFQTISEVTRAGGRLVSVEPSGVADQQFGMLREHQADRANYQYFMTGQFPSLQVPVDIFYEVPHHPNPEIYDYQIVSCPMVSVLEGFPRPRYVSSVDWTGIMSQYLGCGWKLVEIFDDKSTVVQSNASTWSQTSTKNCLWIFEKPVSRKNDNTAYYECTMVDYWYETRIHAGFGGGEVEVIANYEPLITNMGTAGWQIVRILDTPDSDISGVGFSPTTTTRQMVLFQRRIAGRCEETAAGVAAGAVVGNPDGGAWSKDAPPSYDEVTRPAVQ